MSFNMFTPEGDQAVEALIYIATECKLNWPETVAWLELLATRKGFEEAMDTDVRIAVYDRLNFAATSEFFA